MEVECWGLFAEHSQCEIALTNARVSPQAFPRLALSLCMPPTGWWRGTDTSSLPCSTLLVGLFNFEGLEGGKSLLFATLVKDLRKAVQEWKEYPALPCTGRKHERKSCVNPSGLDCDQPLIVGSHTTSCNVEYNKQHFFKPQLYSHKLLPSCLFKRADCEALSKSTSNGKREQMVLKAIVEIPKV